MDTRLYYRIYKDFSKKNIDIRKIIGIYIYIYIYIYILSLLFFIWWSPFIPSRNLDEVFPLITIYGSNVPLQPLS